MFITLNILLISVLAIILYQDMMRRTIHAILPLGVLLVSIAINLISNNYSLYQALYNLCFIAINILGITLYFSLKYKTLVNPIDSFIGMGDIAFFIAITPLFNLKPFILFFIIGLLFSLLVHCALHLFRKTKTIPLAGYLSLFLAITIIADNILEVNITL
ncbi:prepilin peptidase [Hyunsoonleella pacifica]|uniref:Uncharacterized protein n=1 Tax=Hyunsoonleella pacifica TaxID=1080224 RepID=A0A4Q9FIU2_9FLAO|nr:prepilin peptidase [Hyunsoonleella pacifica]TBN11964.1 hypothetical protein EYD46_17505 [Hyunsoonleella pacifica]